MSSTRGVIRAKSTDPAAGEEAVEKVVVRFGSSLVHIHMKSCIAAAWKDLLEFVVSVNDFAEKVGQEGMDLWEVRQEQI